VARGWSGYLAALIKGLGSKYPDQLHAIPIGDKSTWFYIELDLTALFAILLIASLLSLGVKSSTIVNNFIVVVTLAVLLFVIVYGFSLARIGLKTVFCAYIHFFFPVSFEILLTRF